MNKWFISLLVGTICLFPSLPTFSQNQVKKVVFILVDGIPADVLETVHTPHIDSLSKAGKYLRAYVGGEKGGYSQSPTISAVGYNSLLTGTWVNKHNVWDNDIKEPNYAYPSIFRLFKDQYPQKKIGIFSTWQDNRTKLVGEGLPQTANIRFDYRADGYELDTLRFPHDKDRNFIHVIDTKVVEEAASCITKNGPELSWIYLEYTDDMGHMYGDSEQFYKAVEKMDSQVGKIAQAVHYRQKKFKEQWLIVVTTDHGRDEQTGKSHGGQTPRQRSTWLVTNHPQLNAYAQYYPVAVVDIMPTIARFLNVAIPVPITRELDGLPLTGSVSLADVQVNYFQHKLDVTWKALEPEGIVKIWLATTNEFKTGGKDTYQLMAEIPLSQQSALIDVRNYSSSFYKIVLEAPSNSINKWVFIEKQ